ncbi:hypothetical protein CY0110_15722 [Crocosphaera chwakensis CCY0110]|uniref:Uncharacterized protein n=1 Tax=Crocosphaera chwakensis CCY0110 TaxID=391612 RepID=A3IHH6_9CHRO|nr:hypothetical protein CY0110_15722 [Crocosphaera chwakensis CCY0110]
MADSSMTAIPALSIHCLTCS